QATEGGRRIVHDQQGRLARHDLAHRLTGSPDLIDVFALMEQLCGRTTAPPPGCGRRLVDFSCFPIKDHAVVFESALITDEAVEHFCSDDCRRSIERVSPAAAAARRDPNDVTWSELVGLRDRVQRALASGARVYDDRSSPSGLTAGDPPGGIYRVAKV